MSDENGKCLGTSHEGCGEELRQGERLCFFCRELENNRRYRQHMQLGEYAPQPEETNR